MYWRSFVYTFCVLFFVKNTTAQNITQSLRGMIKDKESQYPLEGAIISIADIPALTTASDAQGEYHLDSVPVGRHSILVSYIGYKKVVLDNIIFTSAKEMILNLELETDFQSLDEVYILATKTGEPINEMAYISARQFSVEETDRYAGSRGDPSRMASNYAGVQGADDSRNDIVVRGNSPSGVLWRMEGIDIPNPNHFAIPGTSGGSVSILNNKILSNSDFYTSAFPAEYGNSVAAAFDLRLRNGNNNRHERSFQFGILGTELMLEGPISRKNHSTYLFTYRYATLDIFQKIGLKIGTDAVPKYQDASFKLNFPMKNNQYFSVFGVGGLSKIYILISDQKKPSENIYGQNDRDQYFASSVGWIGATYSKSYNTKTYLKVATALSYIGQDVHHEMVYRHTDASNGEYINDSIIPTLGYNFAQKKASANVYLTHKWSHHLTMKAGILNELHILSYQDSIRETIDTAASNYYQYYHRWNTQNTYVAQVQPFVQFKYEASSKLVLNFGIHSHYYQLSNTASWLEPRAGLNYMINDKNSLAFGVGLHSQIQSPYLHYYFKQNNNQKLHNEKIGFTKSRHIVLGYTYRPIRNLSLKAETYYQSLYDVPVYKYSSSFSLANTGVGFSRYFPDSLVNEGTAYNYGIEFSAERFFTKNFYFLFTSTLYNSRYKGSDHIERDTDFNGHFILNGLTSKEWILKNRNAFNLGVKLTYSGGRKYSPIDTVQTALQKEIIEIDAQKNTLKMPDYFRADVRLSYKINRPKVTHEIALDLVNILNTKNVLKLTYAPDPATGSIVRFDYQLGFLPLFYYKIDF